MSLRHLLLGYAVTAALSPLASADPRQAFEIVAGPVAGDLYLQGERLAGVVSHPPGASRCTNISACGPTGLIATVRASAGAAGGLLAIARGEVSSAFAPADVAAAMRLNAGKGKQNRSRLRALALMGQEAVYIVAATKGPVKSVASMRGRWIGMGERGGRVRIAADAILAATRISPSSIRAANVEGAAAVKLLRERKLDAFIWAGPVLPPEVQTLIAEGVARLVALDAPIVDRLVAARLGYLAYDMPGVAGPLKTIASPVVWLADDKEDPDLVFTIVRAAFSAENTHTLNHGPGDPANVVLTPPPENFVIPRHSGAERYFAQSLKPSN